MGFDFSRGVVFGGGAGIATVVEIAWRLVGIDHLRPIDIGEGASRQSQRLEEGGQAVVVGVRRDGFDELSDGVVAEVGDSSSFVAPPSTAIAFVVDGDAAGVILEGIGGVVGIEGMEYVLITLRFYD